MYPMDFEEFLWANENNNLMDLIRKCFEEKKPLGQLMHREAMDYFKQYLIVGGMPQAVETYIKTKSFKEVDLIKRDILNLYKDDIVKYLQHSFLLEMIQSKYKVFLRKYHLNYKNMKKDFRSIQCKKMQDIEIIKMLFSGFKNQ